MGLPRTVCAAFSSWNFCVSPLSLSGCNVRAAVLNAREISATGETMETFKMV